MAAADEVQGETIPRRLIPVAAVDQVVERGRVVDHEATRHPEAQAQDRPLAPIGVQQEQLAPPSSRRQGPAGQRRPGSGPVEAFLQVPGIVGAHVGDGSSQGLHGVEAVELDLEDLGHGGMMAALGRSTSLSSPSGPPPPALG